MSLGAIIPIGAAGVVAYGAVGEVQLLRAAALLAGSMIGARYGAGLLARIAERPLKMVFGVPKVVIVVLMVVSS
jgi:uncharacterized membrane protein YfcA